MEYKYAGALLRTPIRAPDRAPRGRGQGGEEETHYLEQEKQHVSRTNPNKSDKD